MDIYHISPNQPRFAFVTYTDPASGLQAIQELNRKPINLESPFAKENVADLAVWARWSGQLTVVRAEPPRLVPTSVASEFPDLPDWAAGVDKAAAVSQPVSAALVPGNVTEPGLADSRKRERGGTGAPGPDQYVPSNTLSAVLTFSAAVQHEETTPRKRARPAADGTEPSPTIQGNFSADSVQAGQAQLTTQVAINQPSAHDVPHRLPPFPPSIKQENDNVGPALQPEVETAVKTELPSILPPTPITAANALTANGRMPSPTTAQVEAADSASKSRLTNSAAEPQEYPIKVGVKTLKAQIDLVRRSFVKVDNTNWIAHSCFIASAIDQSRRALQEDLYHTDNGFLTGRDLEKSLAARGYSADRVDTFIKKVLKVLDGIALAEEEENGGKAEQADEDVSALEQELELALADYPDQTKEAMSSASTLMEYLGRGKEAQERKRLEIERRVQVLEGMVKVGEVVGGVVRFLLSESK